jgi:hypothetical protein
MPSVFFVIVIAVPFYVLPEQETIESPAPVLVVVIIIVAEYSAPLITVTVALFIFILFTPPLATVIVIPAAG